MRASLLCHAAALLIAYVAPLAADAATPDKTGAIVFSRSQLKADGTASSSRLWLTSPTGSPLQALTPRANAEYDASATWSPSGTRIAFEHVSASTDTADRVDIFTVDRQGHHLHQLTSGAGNFQTPAWGPRNTIAFVSSYRDHDCVSLVQASGHHQQDLFCPPRPARVMRPTWSRDGSSLYIHAGYYADRLQNFWRSLVYRVDASTGAATLLGDGILDGPRSLEFSPDGSRGLYSDVYTNDLMLLDFNSGQLHTIGSGYAPRWSKDGRRIAFTREVFEITPPDIRFYEPLYVMDANGSNVRRITRSRIDNHAYTAAEWSDDGVHVLVNRRIFLDPSLTVARFAMRIIDVDTREVTPVAGGYAEPGAWFEH